MRGKKRFYVVALALYCQFTAGQLWADVSGLFPGSLANQASGLFKWTAWDHVTNPYIYSRQEKDVISAIFTPDVHSGSMAFGGKVTLFNFPLFLAFSHKNQGVRATADKPAQVSLGEVEDQIGELIDTENRDIRVMIGSTVPLFGLFGLSDLGIGLYFRTNAYFLDEQRDRDSRLLENVEPTSPFNDKKQLPGDTYGIQFGTFKFYSDSRNSFASTISVEYSNLGQVITPEDGSKLNSPRLDAFLFADIFASGNRLGRNNTGQLRKEVNINYLGWLPTGYSSDAGLSLNFTLPFGEGADERPQGDGTTNRDNAKLSGISFIASLFYDKDFYVDSDATENSSLKNIFRQSIFRVQPVATYLMKSEEVNFDSGRRFAVEESTFLISINFKYILYLNKEKTFHLLMGWGPILYPLNEYKEMFRAEADDELQTSAYKEKVLRVNLENYTLGFAYDFSKSLSFYVNFGEPRGSGSVLINPKDFIPARSISSIRSSHNSNEGSRDQFSITNISFGADYQF